MLERKLVVHHITIERDGSIVVSMVHELTEDGSVVGSGGEPHDVRIDPGADLEGVRQAENAAARGTRADISKAGSGWDRVAKAVQGFHTPDVVSAFAAKRAAQVAARESEAVRR